MTPTIDFHTDDRAAWDLAVDDLLLRVQWRRTDGRAAARSTASGRKFAAFLAKDDALPDLPRRAAERLAWSADSFDFDSRCETLAVIARMLSAKKSADRGEKQLGRLLAEFTACRPAEPRELLILLTLLATVRGRLKRSTRLELFRVTLLSARSHAVSIEQEPPGPQPVDVRAVRRGELPLLIGHVLETVHGSTHLRRQGRRAIADLVDEITDTDGTPASRVVDRLPWLLASVTRADAIPRGRALLGKPPRGRLAALTEAAVHLAGPGLQLGAAKHSPAILRAAAASLAGGGSRATRRLLKRDRPVGRGPENSLQTDWGGMAVLFGGTPTVDRVLRIHTDGPTPAVELSVDGRAVLEGEWRCDVVVGGRAVPEPPTWNSVCWYADEDCAYLELQATTGDVTQTRHFVTVPDGGLILLSACVRGAGERDVAVESSLRLAGGVRAKPHADQTSVSLRGAASGRAVPLAIPQRRESDAAGTLEAADGELRLTQVSAAGGCVSPLLLDFGGSRKTPGWRGLSVSEAGHAVGPARAAAFLYRLGVSGGARQWVYYQGLSKNVAPRTVLGHHTNHEMVFGRFCEGDVEPLVHVDAG